MSLDPVALRQKREQEQAAQNQQPDLEPPFPYTKRFFDPVRFGLTKPPTKPDSAAGG
jgi:hypothetical protein